MIAGGPKFLALTCEGDTVASDEDLDALLWALLCAVVTRHGQEELVVWSQGNRSRVEGDMRTPRSAEPSGSRRPSFAVE